MKDIQSSFGTIIAFLLPGLVAIGSISICSGPVRAVLQTFTKAESNVGLSVLVLLAATAVGLNLSAIRHAIFERAQIATGTFAKLLAPEKFSVFQALAEGFYRFHQFYGNVAIAMGVLLICLLLRMQQLHAWCSWWWAFVAATIALGALNAIAAIDSLKKYRTRTDEVAEGKTQ